MKTAKHLTIALMVTAALALISGAVLASDPIKIKDPIKIRPTAPEKEIKKDVRVPPATLCYDLKADLLLNKTISSGNGVFTLKGKICNIGPGDFIVPPSADTVAVYYVYRRYPPATYGQVQDVKTILTQKIKNLKKGACMEVNTTYTLPGVIHWGSLAASATARQAAVQFTLRSENSKNIKDCNWQNDTVTLPEVFYMEKITP